MTRGAEPSGAPVRSPVLLTAPRGSAPMAKILVVDDDPDITFAVSLYLKREQHEVRTAASRAEGMEAVTAFSPDLIILDVMMEQPDDGIAMAQDLRRSGSTIPIIMLTSVGQVTGMSYGRDSDLVPVEVFFEKPVRPDDLLKAVAGLLKK
jgi:DNA-binding response OmpR family regulator